MRSRKNMSPINVLIVDKFCLKSTYVGGNISKRKAFQRSSESSLF